MNAYDILSTDILDDVYGLLLQEFATTALNEEHKHIEGNNLTQITMCNIVNTMDITGHAGDQLQQLRIDQHIDRKSLCNGQILADGHWPDTEMTPKVNHGLRAMDANTDSSASFKENWGGDTYTQYPNSGKSTADCGRILDTATIDQLMNIPVDEILGISPTAAMDPEPSPNDNPSAILLTDVKNGLNCQYTVPNPHATGTATTTAESVKTSSIKDVLKKKINVKRQHLGQEQLTVDFGEKPSYKLTAEEKEIIERRKKGNRESANRSRINRQKKSKYLKKANAASEMINQMLMKQIEALKQDKNLLEYKWKLHQRLFHGADGSRKPVARMSANDLLGPTEKNLASNNKL